MAAAKSAAGKHQLEGTIFKKCDRALCKPVSNKLCANGKCQHTCDSDRIERCAHKWTLRYSANGKQREESFADTVNPNTGRVNYGSGRKLAEDAQLKLTHDKRAQGATFIDPKNGSEDFCDAVLKFINTSRNTIESTKKSYRQNLNSCIRPVFAGKTITQAALMRDEADELINVAMIRQAKVRRNTTRRLIAETLEDAVATDKITRHRVAGLKVANREVSEDEHEERGFVHLTDAQVKTLAEGFRVPRDGKAPRTVPGCGTVVWVQRCMGLRISEAIGLEKSDFKVSDDGKDVTLRLRWQSSQDGTKRVALKHRKSGQGRDIPVPAFVWAMIKDAPDGPLFPGKETRYTTYNTVSKKLTRAAAAMGVEGVTTHTLRHLFATDELSRGMKVTNLSKVLGHKNAAITLAIYVHEDADWQEDARARMDARWGLAA